MGGSGPGLWWRLAWLSSVAAATLLYEMGVFPFWPVFLFGKTTHIVPEQVVRRGARCFPSLTRTAKLRASGPARGVQDTA